MNYIWKVEKIPTQFLEPHHQFWPRLEELGNGIVMILATKNGLVVDAMTYKTVTPIECKPDWTRSGIKYDRPVFEMIYYETGGEYKREEDESRREYLGISNFSNKDLNHGYQQLQELGRLSYSMPAYDNLPLWWFLNGRADKGMPNPDFKIWEMFLAIGTLYSEAINREVVL